MKSIWRFVGPNPHRGAVAYAAMPVGARIVHVGMQQKQIMLWAEVDADEKTTERREFFSIATGQTDWDPRGDVSTQYVGTVQDGFYVWHVYEIVWPS